MADYEPKTTQKSDIPDDYRFKAYRDYESDWDIHRNYIQRFDPWEAMLMGQVYDSVSNSIDGSKITDSYATTLAKERADRVMAKLPDGQTESTGKADIGKAAFFDILRQKWVYPNANAQHSFPEKLNMWQFYSSVYGYMPMFYDLNAAPSGYVGPDCWLWNPRNLVPQQGRASIADMEYITALTWVNKSFLEGVLEQNGGEAEDADEDTAGDNDATENPENDGGWDVEALQLLVAAADRSTNPDATKDSKVVRDRTPQSQKRGIQLATRYEAGDDGQWITFAPDYNCIEVRRIDNPHKNGKIPFVIKYSQPLFDSFYGLGDFQRAMPLQFARDGLTNFYFKGIKMNLIPPIVANANGVLKHTLDYREGGVMLETIPNSIRRLETSTAGLATYQAAQQNLTGSLLSLYGSQNASIPGSDSLNPTQGKTPQAIDLYADKEATRDGSERRHLEDAIQQLTEGFYDIIANVCTEEVPVALFADDIKDIIKSGLPDVEDLFKPEKNKSFKLNDSKTAGTLTIDPTKLNGMSVRFQINPDSTAKTNKQAILTALQDFLQTLGKFQNIITQDPGITVHWDKILDTYEEVSGIPNAAEFITFDPQASQQAKVAAQQATQQQMQNPVQTEGGQIHEMADLGKMFAAMVGKPGYEDVENALLKTMGIQGQVQPQPTEPAPAAAPAGTVISSGHMFQDPHVAAAAEAINGLAPPEAAAPAAPAAAPAPSEPSVASSGHVFNDATIGQAAEAINGVESPPPPKPEPTKTKK